MNTTSQLVFTPKLIFVVVAGLIVLSMIMGRKQGATHRSHVGWWIGLGVLLVIVSSFLGYSRMSVSPVVEERHSGRSAFDHAIAEVNEKISAGVKAAQDSVKESLDEVSKNMEEAQQSLNTAVRETKTTSKSKKAVSGKVTSSTPAPPTSSVQWTEELKDSERSTQQDIVDKKLLQKAADSVNRWLNERLPIKNYGLHVITAQWLKDNGAFPTSIEYIPDEVPRANTDQKDKLYGGTLTVVLQPNMQQTIMDLGFKELEEILQSDKLMMQFVIFNIVMGITGLMAILGLVKFVVSHRVAAYSQRAD